MLAKQSYGQQFWSLPGGVMEEGESIDQSAIREVKEETGLDIRLGRLVGIYSKPDETFHLPACPKISAIICANESRISRQTIHIQ